MKLTFIAILLIPFILMSACFTVPTQSKSNYYQTSYETPSYDDLFRNNEQYKGKLVSYRGEVVQVLETGSGYQLRVNITRDIYDVWDDTVFLNYNGSRVLKDDIIEFIGSVDGLMTYKSVLNASITIPEITVTQLKIIKKAGDR